MASDNHTLAESPKCMSKKLCKYSNEIHYAGVYCRSGNDIEMKISFVIIIYHVPFDPLQIHMAGLID